MWSWTARQKSQFCSLDQSSSRGKCSIQDFLYWSNGTHDGGGMHESFLPDGTTHATVEYLPNIGSGASEVEMVSVIVRRLVSMGAIIVGIEILPKAHALLGCPSCLRPNQALRTHRALMAVFSSYAVPVVTLGGAADIQQNVFNNDGRHANAAGHRAIYKKVWEALSFVASNRTAAPNQTGPFNQNRSSTRSRSVEAVEAPVTCLLGKEMAPIILPTSRGFERVEMLQEPKGLHEPKVAWETRQAGSHLSLCIEQRQLNYKKEARGRDRRTLRTDRMQLAVLGMQTSHARNMPFFGIARVSCHGGCSCICAPTRRMKKRTHEMMQLPSSNDTPAGGCLIETLRNLSSVTVTQFYKILLRWGPLGNTSDQSALLSNTSTLGDAGIKHSSLSSIRVKKSCACELRVRNTDVSGERSRLLVRALMLTMCANCLGPNDFRTSWVNNYFLGLGGMNQ